MNETNRRHFLVGASALLASTTLGSAVAQSARPQKFSSNELLDSGHRFFGSLSRGLAQIVELSLIHI